MLHESVHLMLFYNYAKYYFPKRFPREITLRAPSPRYEDPEKAQT